MTKFAKLLLFVAITYLFGASVYLLAQNVTGVSSYDFFILEDLIGKYLCEVLTVYGTWFFAIPVLARVYSSICYQLSANGKESSKGKVTH
jgi:hypothetical protein